MGLGWPTIECVNKQLLGNGIIKLPGYVSQPPDSVPPQEVSQPGLAGGGRQLSGGGATAGRCPALLSTASSTTVTGKGVSLLLITHVLDLEYSN